MEKPPCDSGGEEAKGKGAASWLVERPPKHPHSRVEPPHGIPTPRNSRPPPTSIPLQQPSPPAPSFTLTHSPRCSLNSTDVNKGTEKKRGRPMRCDICEMAERQVPKRSGRPIWLVSLGWWSVLFSRAERGDLRRLI